MNVTLVLIVASLALLLPTVSCNDGSFKILGGYTQRYASQTASSFTYENKWGFILQMQNTVNSVQIAAGKVVKLPAGHGKCNGGYCRFYFVIGGPNSPYPNNYQVLGSYVDLQNKGSTYTVSKEGWGLQEAFGHVEDIMAFEGFMWSTKLNDWGYGYIHLVLNLTSLPSNVDSFIVDYRKRTDLTLVSESTNIGQRQPESEPHMISELQSSSNAFADNTVARWVMYVAPTELVDFIVENALSSLMSDGDAIIDSLTLENRGHGLESTQLAQVGTTDSVEISSTCTFSRSFDFAIDVSVGLEFSVFGNGGSFETNIHFGYSSTSEISETKTVSKTISVTWPNECPSGFRITHRFHSLSQSLITPVVFFLERAGIRWTESNEMSVTLRKFSVDAETCCLFGNASPNCDSEHLPLC